MISQKEPVSTVLFFLVHLQTSSLFNEKTVVLSLYHIGFIEVVKSDRKNGCVEDERHENRNIKLISLDMVVTW